jgi:hypothetical protein
MFTKFNISIADKIAASKAVGSDPNIGTGNTPQSADGSPGDSSVTKPDVSGINNAGPSVQQHQQKAQSETGPQKRSAAVPGDQQYENPQDAEFPEEQDPKKRTPTPKSKGFMESLIEAKATEYMQSKMQTPEADNGAKGKNVDEPNIQKAPDNKRVERPQTTTWSPSNITSNDPGMPNQGLAEGVVAKGKNQPGYSAPGFKAIGYSAPKINIPKPKF